MRSLKTLSATLFLLMLCLCLLGCTEYYDEETGIYDETYIEPFVSTEEITETEPAITSHIVETTEALPETQLSTTAEIEEITTAETELVTTAEAIIESETIPTSEESDTEESESTETTENDAEKQDEEKQEYLLNTNTKKFHLLSCKSGQKTKEENRAYHKGTKDEIISQGYSPCKNCKP